MEISPSGFGGLWLVEILSAMHAGDFQRRLLLLLFLPVFDIL